VQAVRSVCLRLQLQPPGNGASLAPLLLFNVARESEVD
jgi:hypothetical protein